MKAKIKPRINLEDRPALETVIPLATPFVIFVDPASACNFKCQFCPTGHHDMIKETGRFQGLMKFEVFQKIVDDLVEFEKHKALGGRARALFVPHSEFARTASVAAFAYRHVDPIRDRMCVVAAAVRSSI